MKDPEPRAFLSTRALRWGLAELCSVAGNLLPGGLGVRRLRVIDLETGDQPIADEDGGVQVVFNGEIYNFRQLRAELESRGHRFATAGDTEVLAHGWEEWGEELPKKLRGMFAFALWDRDQRRLFLARDHFGIKPLFYARTSDTLLFASEIKSLLAATARSPSPATGACGPSAAVSARAAKRSRRCARSSRTASGR